MKIAVDMVAEGLITEKEAMLRLDAERMHFFLHPAVDPNAPKTVLAKGLPASPGAATGKLFTMFMSLDSSAAGRFGW